MCQKAGLREIRRTEEGRDLLSLGSKFAEKYSRLEKERDTLCDQARSIYVALRWLMSRAVEVLPLKSWGEAPLYPSPQVALGVAHGSASDGDQPNISGKPTCFKILQPSKLNF